MRARAASSASKWEGSSPDSIPVWMTSTSVWRRHFYRDRLGFDVEMRPAPGFAALTKHDLRLLLNAPGAGGAGRAGGSAAEPGGWNRFQLTVDDLGATVDRLRSEGARFRGDIVEGRGGSQILIEDPSGNAVELFRPGSP